MGSQRQDNCVHNIKRNILSVYNCPDETYSTLSILLEQSVLERPSKIKVRLQRQTDAKARRVALKELTQPKVSPKPGSNSKALSDADKLKLATDVINAALKALTEAIRSKPQATAPDPKPAEVPSDQLEPGQSHQSIGNVVSCARIALASLSNIRSCKKNNRDYSIEAGRSAFVGKLIALSIDDVALSELRLLSSRLKVNLPGPQCDESTSDIENDLSQLFTLGDCSDDKQALRIVIASQLHYLKLIGRSDIVSAALIVDHIRTTASSGPFQLISRCYQAGYSSIEDTIRQYRNLAQALASIAKTLQVANSQGTKGFEDNRSHLMLQYQILSTGTALQARLVLGKQCDRDAESLPALASSIRMFLGGKSRLDGVAYNRITNELGNIFDICGSLHEQSAEISKLKATLAIFASDHVGQEAIDHHFRAAIDSLPQRSRSDLDTAALLIPICIDGMESRASDTLLCHGLQRLAALLQTKPLNHNARLDDMLVSVATLRRKLVEDLRLKWAKANEDLFVQTDLDKYIFILPSIASFVFHCLQHSCVHQEDAGAHQQQIASIVNRIARQTIDSILLLSRIASSVHLACSSTTYEGLRACTGILVALEEAHGNHVITRLDDRMAGSHVKLSDHLFALGLAYQIQENQFERKIDLLKGSLEILTDAPAETQRTGRFPEKLTKFIKVCGVYEAMQDMNEGLGYLIRYCKTSGALTRAVLADPPGGSLLDDEPETGLLDSTAEFFVQLCVIDKAPTLPSLFAKFLNDINPLSNGFLVECQLRATLETLRSGLQIRADTTAAALEALDSYYPRERYPVHRLRVVTLVLHIAHFWPAFGEGHLLARCEHEVTDFDANALAQDEDLALEASFLLATSHLCMACSTESLKMELVQAGLSTMSRAVGGLREGVSCIRRHAPLVWAQLISLADHLQAHAIVPEYIGTLRLLDTLIEAGLGNASWDKFALTLRAIMAHIDAGNIDAAKALLEQIERSPSRATTNPTVMAQCEILKAMIALEQGGISEASACLRTASHSLESGYLVQMVNDDKIIRMSQNAAVGILLGVYSDYYDKTGAAGNALLFARASAKSATSAWRAELKKSQTNRKLPSRINDPTANGPNEGCDFSGEAISKAIDRNCPNLLVTAIQLTDSLSRLARRLSDTGLILEGRQHLHQAERLTEMLRLTRRSQRLSLLSARFSIKESQIETAVKTLSKLTQDVAEIDPLGAEARLELCTAFYREGDIVRAKLMLNGMRKLLYSLASPQIDTQTDGVEKLANSLERVRISKAGRPIKYKRVTRPLRTDQSALDRSDTANINNGICMLRRRLQIRARMLDMILSEGDSKIPDILADLDKTALSFSAAKQRLLGAMLRSDLKLKNALDILSINPVFASLTDGPLAHPSKAEETYSNPTTRKPTTSMRSRRIQKGSRSKQPAATAEPDVILVPSEALSSFRVAAECLTEVVELSCNGASTQFVHELAYKLVRTYMYLSATETALPAEFPHLLAASLEIGRSTATLRQHCATFVEKMFLGQNVGNLLKKTSNVTIESDVVSGFAESFQETYVDILPSAWTVISLSLSDQRNELHISKVRRGYCPFTVTLPLGRNIDGSEENRFSFDLVRDELREIIRMANFSSHDSSDMSKRGAKAEWWKIRKALDERLKELLEGMDKTWLGGFAGLFNTRNVAAKAFAVFTQTFYNILDAHLPSRSRYARTTTPNSIQLHSQVLELFIGLRQSSAEGDLDEALLDLLAFVVDILQFTGERNAMDEIDFDAMVLDVIDALNEYHLRADRELSLSEEAHFILILDKHLHHFPWESLPCMQGLSTTRLPSFAMLRTRIIEQRKSIGWAADRDILSIDAQKGAFILNPSADLPNTEKIFTEPLESLPDSWSRMTGRAPSEQEVEDLLRASSIYIYLGHGSGGQYIRSRTIKKLGKCAISLLLGCSSATVVEAGQYESHGTPLTYLQGGAPAVVGTLWDVTDKDIDRFSLRLLQSWGLFSASWNETADTSPSGVIAKTSRGREKPVPAYLQASASKSLDTALSEARGECLLRYLNGAAPVVYGVPVILR